LPWRVIGFLLGRRQRLEWGGGRSALVRRAVGSRWRGGVLWGASHPSPVSRCDLAVQSRFPHNRWVAGRGCRPPLVLLGNHLCRSAAVTEGPFATSQLFERRRTSKQLPRMAGPHDCAQCQNG